MPLGSQDYPYLEVPISRVQQLEVDRRMRYELPSVPECTRYEDDSVNEGPAFAAAESLSWLRRPLCSQLGPMRQDLRSAATEATC